MKIKFVQIFSLAILITSFSTFTAQSNNYKLERYTINNGLSNNSVNCVIQTKDGYLWIATKDGLNRYDGQTFKVFKNNPQDKTSLPENYIMFLYEDRENNLWIGSWGSGICKYDPVHESFLKIDSSVQNDYVQDIEEDDAGNIWYATTPNGLKKYDTKSGAITAFNKKSKGKNYIPTENVMDFYFENKNTLWLATWDNGIIKFDLARGMISHFAHDEKNSNSLINNSLWFINKADSNSLYISTNRGLDLFDLKKEIFVHNPKIPNSLKPQFSLAIRQTLIDHKKRLWIGSYDYAGILITKQNGKSNEQFTHLVHEDDDQFSLVCESIRWLYEDKQDNIWIGTEDGLNKLPNAQPFEQFKYMPTRKNTLGGRVGGSIYEGANNILWVGYNGNGFDKIDLTRNKITHFQNIPGNSNSLKTNDVISLIEDKHGITWIGTRESGLERYDSRTNTFKHFSHNASDPNSIKSNWVQYVLETSGDELLVGTNDGLQIFDRKTEKFSSYSPVLSPTSEKIPNYISVITLYEDRQQNIWIGTWLEGLFQYDHVSKKINHYMPGSGINSISGNKISSIVEDSNGIMWIGTFGNGLNRFDKSSGKFSHYNISNGLPNDCVFGTLVDKNNYVWASTMKGLARLNPNNGVFRVYDVEDGLVTNQFNWRAYSKNKKGKMYFGGISGFVSFFPDSMRLEKRGAVVTLTSFKLFNKEEFLNRALLNTPEIKLAHNQNFFSIDFIALDLLPVYKHKYVYKLEGIDPQWVDAGSRTTAFYTDIKDGSYRFLVKACNADGVWGEPTVLSIIITPAWWNTWWFKTISLGIILGLFFAGYRYRLNQLMKIEKIRFSIASDLHDEIGSNLSSISVDSQSLLSSSTLNETEKELSLDISKTAKETVDAMRDIIWFINPKNDLNEDIIFKMKQTAAKYLGNIEWEFRTSEDVRIDLFNLDARRNIFLLYKEALTNVVRHSQAKKCLITMSAGINSLVLQIKDDGVGFELKNYKSTNGIRSMEARAEKVNGKLNIVSGYNKGTVIELII